MCIAYDDAAAKRAGAARGAPPLALRVVHGSIASAPARRSVERRVLHGRALAWEEC